MKILFSDSMEIESYWGHRFDWSINVGKLTVKNLHWLSKELIDGAGVWKALNKRSVPVKVDFEGDFSIESILWHLCGMIYPQSAYLSRQCVKTLDARDKGEISDMEALEKFTSWIDASVCEVQKDTLRGLVEGFILGLSEEVESNG